jgi:hypothetical protein
MEAGVFLSLVYAQKCCSSTVSSIPPPNSARIYADRRGCWYPPPVQMQRALVDYTRKVGAACGARAEVKRLEWHPVRNCG